MLYKIYKIEAISGKFCSAHGSENEALEKLKNMA